MKILIAEDEPVSRRSLAAALTRLGHDVVAVQDGEAAVAHLVEPDSARLAILDWMMPGMDGLTACRTLRQHPGPYTYVIMLTARQGRAAMVEGLDAGADDFLTKPFDVVELRARLRSGERIIDLQAHLLRTQKELEHAANHDRLTGLWNRGRIFDQLALELARAERERTSVAVVVADLDRFKHVNDAYGHAAGDTVLRDIGQRMRSVLRATDVIGRYGGEEFLIVMPRANTAGGRDVAERVRGAVERKAVAHGGRDVPVTVSLGVASSAASGFDAATLLKAADDALYRAKALGRNCVQAA